MQNHTRTLWLGALAVTAIACSAPSKGAPSDVGGSQYDALEQLPTTTPSESLTARDTHSIKTVFLIMMENHNWSDIKGSASAPFINGTLLPSGAHAEGYYDNFKAVHPSEPNYIWLEAGDNLAIEDDDTPAANHRSTTKHLTALLDDADVSWKSYQEGISGNDCPLSARGLYDPKHNPMVYFDDITDGVSQTSQHCIDHVRPYEELAQDLSKDSVASYNFITPNLCDDMHNGDGCKTADAVKNGDDWLASEVPKILGSAAYKRGGAIFITWDESEGGELPIGMIVISPFAKTSYANSKSYTHSSMLRTAQEIFAVSPLLRDAANSESLSDLFVTYP
jgi:phospholipase C